MNIRLFYNYCILDLYAILIFRRYFMIQIDICQKDAEAFKYFCKAWRIDLRS